MLVLVLVPDAVQAYAPYMIGALRSPGEPAFVAGHRGDRADAPENTLPAFEAAFAGGLEFVETDVQLTADGFPVLLHDPTVDRTTDGTGAVADLTLAQVQALDAGSWFGAEFAGHPHPAARRVPRPARRHPAQEGAHRAQGVLDPRRASAASSTRSSLRGVQNRVVFASFHLGTVENLGRRGRRHPAHHHPA